MMAVSDSAADLATFYDLKTTQLGKFEAEAARHNRQAVIATAGLAILGCAVALCAVALASAWFRFHFITWPAPLESPGPFSAQAFASPLLAAALTISAWKVMRRRRNEMRSADLLEQFSTILRHTLNTPFSSLRDLQATLVNVECRFLGYDDELTTKKYLWKYYLEYLSDFSGYLPAGVATFDFRRTPLWLVADAASDEVTDGDEDFVYRNWQVYLRALRLKRQRLYGRPRTLNREIGRHYALCQIDDLTRDQPLVFERMLFNSQVCAGYREFEKKLKINYLTPVAKFRLVAFVDGILSAEHPVPESAPARLLLFQKNAQIDHYKEAFWRAKFRRSMGPVPNLIAALLAARHEFVSDPKLLTEALATSALLVYERRFKELEQRFILTSTDGSTAKLVKESVSDAVSQKLVAAMLKLRANKEAQVAVYFDNYRKYLRLCRWYTVLEVAVAILAIPSILALIALSVRLFDWTGFESIGFMVLFFLIAGLEYTLVQRHSEALQRKELYSLIYQKIAALLSDYRLFGHPRYINAELVQLEDSIVRAAALSGFDDVAFHIDSVADVDIAMGNDELWEKLEFLQPYSRYHDNPADPQLPVLVAKKEHALKERAQKPRQLTRREVRNLAKSELLKQSRYASYGNAWGSDGVRNRNSTTS